VIADSAAPSAQASSVKGGRLRGLAVAAGVALGLGVVGIGGQASSTSFAQVLNPTAAAADVADADSSSDGPASLPQMRMQLRHNLLAATLPEKQNYREALFSLEKQLASGGDFKGAIRARDERLALEQEIAIIQHQLMHPPRVLSPASLAETVELKPAAATLTAATLADAGDKESVLTNWAAEATATWTLPSLPAGGYEIYLTYTLKPGMTPVLHFKENYYRLSATLSQAAETPTQALLGTLRVREGGATLALSVKELTDPAALRVLGVLLKSAAR